MSQLAKMPLRTAKRLKKLKEIKKVETAIRWHERARKNRQAVATDRYESKQAVLGLMKWEKEQVKHVKSRALEHAREDWKLGPLRPNRAIGHEASTYGALDQEGMRRPPIPVRVQKNRNEVRAKRGLELEYPLVVDDKKYFHIVQDDRVVVIKGREKGKIGIVSEVLDSSHEVIIKDLNTHYADGRVWSTPEGTPAPPKREANNAIPLADVRLVVPYRITTKTAAGEKEIFQDVVVDKVIMERHTTGIDPYTGIDYGKDEFPEEHRFDPETGLPIFKRYIAGTRSLIQWPWEFDPEEHKEPEREVGNASDEKSDVRKGRIGRSLDWLKSRTRGAKNLVAITKKQQEEAEERRRQEQDEKDVVNIEQGISEAQEKTYLKSKVQKLPPDFDDDTGRNLAEVSEESRSFYPTLVYPPFPNELSTELAEDIRLKARADAKDKSEPDTARQDTARKLKEKKERATRREAERLEVMKTPLQLRWEVERAKKLREEKPLVHMDALMLALGSHMQAQGVKLTPKRLKAAEKEVHAD